MTEDLASAETEYEIIDLKPIKSMFNSFMIKRGMVASL